MKLSIKKWCTIVAIAWCSLSLVSCNKELPIAEPITPPTPIGTSILKLLNDPAFSILKAAVTRASTFASTTGNLATLLNDSTATFTFFAPDDAAFQLSGIPSTAVIGALRPGFLDTILKYHLIGGQIFRATSVPPTFPNNLYLQSSLVLSPPSAALPPGLRMPIFPGKAGTVFFANNIPVTQADIAVSNGVVHKVAALVAPPTQFVWDRINTDGGLMYLKAAIIRADSGMAAASTLQAALQNPAANLTVFAPTDDAFKGFLTGQITVALIQQGFDPAMASATATALASSPTVFQNPALANVLTPTTVTGLLVYHILGVRAFSVNIPTTSTTTLTLLNRGIPSHPGVMVKATFGASGVTAATVKGLLNPVESNILINPTPAPGGTSDQLYINGIIHKIDQVLRPQ